MSLSEIDYGFSTIRLLTGPPTEPTKPVGVVAWDASREWFDIRLLDPGEAGRKIPHRRLALARLAERDLRNWAKAGRVPYAETSHEPWQGGFWLAVHELLSTGVRFDRPSAMQRMEDPDEEFPLLFEAVAQPHTAAASSRIGGYISRALGKALDRKLIKRTRLIAFQQHQEAVNRGAIGPQGVVVVEGVNLASVTGRRDADALVSRLERIMAGPTEAPYVVVGYLSSPGGLNGEADMKSWIEARVAPGTTFNLLHERSAFRNATRSALTSVGLVEAGSLLDGLTEGLD